MNKLLFTNKPVKKLFVFLSFILAGVIISLVAVMTVFVNHYIQKNAHENLTFVISRLSNDLDDCLQDLCKSSDNFSASTTVQEFLSNPKRYTDTQRVLDFYTNVASQSNYLNGAVLFDMEGHFYRYGNLYFTNKECIDLFQTLPQKSSYQVITLNGVSYFCHIQGIYNFKDSSMRQLGYILVFTRINMITNLLSQYSIYHNLSLLLTDEQAVIASGGADNALPKNKNAVYMEECNLRTKPYQLIVYIPKGSLFPYNTALFLLISIACILIVCMMGAYIKLINITITVPIDSTIREICTINGSAHSRLSPTDSPWLNQMIISINDLLSRVEEYSHRAFDTQQRLYEAELDKQKMDLYLLRKQINAHFAYNSLNSIYAIAAEHDEQDIQLIATGLAQLMRYSYSPEEYINIFDEMQLIDQYIAIMNIRFRDKFSYEYDFDDRLCAYVILRQIIQPLVENALLHGLENKTENCLLRIVGKIVEHPADEPYVQIIVSDNGIGIPAGKLQEFQTRLHQQEENYAPTGISLINIHRRIQLYHGRLYGLTIESAEGVGTSVTVTFPLIQDHTFL